MDRVVAESLPVGGESAGVGRERPRGLLESRTGLVGELRRPGRRPAGLAGRLRRHPARPLPEDEGNAPAGASACLGGSVRASVTVPRPASRTGFAGTL